MMLAFGKVLLLMLDPRDTGTLLLLLLIPFTRARCCEEKGRIRGESEGTRRVSTSEGARAHKHRRPEAQEREE